jgi:hypothetical protein
MDAIADALAAGRKIEAIKICREATGKDLKDSKDFIETLIPKLKEEDPERFATLGTTKGGCASAALLGIVLGAAGVAGLVRLMS